MKSYCKTQVFANPLNIFGKHGKVKKNRYENVILWWEIGKTHIREFCQQYKCFSTLSKTDFGVS